MKRVVLVLGLLLCSRLCAQEALSVSLNTNTFTVGALPANGVKDTWWSSTGGAYAVTNTGTVAVRLLIAVEPSVPHNWQPGASTGTNTFRMTAAVADGSPRPAHRTLGLEAVVLSPRLDPAEALGFDLAFHAPVNSDVTNTEQSIRIVVSALALDGGP